MHRLKCHVEFANTPHQCHYSRYVFIYAFCGGVVKDREAPVSLNEVRLKNY